MSPFVGAPVGAFAALADRGRFLIFIGGDQVGSEDFELTQTSARSVVEMSMGGQTSRARVELALSPQTEVESYRLEATGACLKVAFEEDIARFEAPGMPRQSQMKVRRPRVVLEDNVFSHYQMLLAMYDHSSGGVQSLRAVVPTANASVSVMMELLGPGRPRRGALADVDADVDADAKSGADAEPPIPLTEYKVVLAGVIGVSVFADSAGRVMYVQVPGQNSTAVREEYQKAIEKAVDHGRPAKPTASVKSAASSASSASARTSDTASAQAAARGYVDQDIVIVSVGGVRLAGTLTLPSAGPNRSVRHPAVLLISGSGPQDRDGNTPPSYQTLMFRRIAQRLASSGIAVLRYDDRGVGASTGDFESAGLFDLAGDARAMVGFLRGHSSIDPARIGVVGHSEGAYIASMLASEDPQIAACVIMAGASTTLDKVMIEQIECQATCDELDETARSLAAGILPAVKQFVKDARDNKSSSAVPGNLEWLREHMQIDPVRQMQAIRVPILIVHGDKDLKVKPYHARVLAEAARRVGNRGVTLVCLPNTTHEFLEWPYRNPNFDPMDPMRIVEGLLATVQGWLVSTL